MKKILDVSAKIIGGYIASVGIKRKLKRYWGTETIDGVEVFKQKKYIYPRGLLDGEESTVKLLKLMDSYEEIASADMKGVDNAWLYLNYQKLSDYSETYFTKDWIADMIENCMTAGEWHTFYINFTSTEIDNSVYSSWNKPKVDKFKGMTKDEIKTYVFTNYQEIYDLHNIQGRADALVTMDELSKFLPFNDEPSDFEIVPVDVKIDSQLKSVADAELGTSYNYVERTISVEYKAKRLSLISSTTTLVGKIYEAASEAERAQILKDSQNNYSDDASYSPPPPPPPPGMFHAGQLKAEYYDGLKAKDAIKLFGMLLDQNYQKKKVAWYKKVLIIVIIVVVIVVSAGSATAAAMTIAQAIAFTATMVALSMMAVSIYGNKNGEYGAAELAGKYGAIAGKVAMIASIYAILANAYNTVAQKWAAEQTAREAAKNAGKEYVENSLADIAFTAVKEMSMRGWNQALSFISNLYQMKAKNEMDDINAEMQETQKKSEEIRQEQSLNDDVEYGVSLNPLLVMDLDHSPLTKMNERYYNETDGRFDPTKFNIIKSGEFKGIGTFSVSYDKQ